MKKISTVKRKKGSRSHYVGGVNLSVTVSNCFVHGGQSIMHVLELGTCTVNVV